MVKYEAPEIVISHLEAEDIVTASAGELTNGDSDKNVLPVWKGEFQE